MIFSITMWTFMNKFENFKTHHNAPFAKMCTICTGQETVRKYIIQSICQWLDVYKQNTPIPNLPG